MRKIIKIIYLLFILSTIITPVSAAKSDKITDELILPDVLLWISAVDPSANYIAITFPVVIPNQKAEMLLADLLKETGWSAVNINIISDKKSQDNPNPMTTIEFGISQTIVTKDNSFLIEPIIKAFRSYKKIKILIMTYPGFQYNGVSNYENKYIDLSMNHMQDSYDFNISVKNPNFTDLKFPIGDNADTKQLNSKSNFTLYIITIILIALLISAGVYLIVRKSIKK